MNTTLVTTGGKALVTSAESEVMRGTLAFFNYLKKYMERGVTKEAAEILEAKVITRASKLKTAAGGSNLTRKVTRFIQNNPKKSIAGLAAVSSVITGVELYEGFKFMKGFITDRAEAAAGNIINEFNNDNASLKEKLEVSLLLAKISLLPEDLAGFLLRSLDRQYILYLDKPTSLKQFAVEKTLGTYNVMNAARYLQDLLDESFEPYLEKGKFVLDQDCLTVIAAGDNNKNHVVSLALKNEAIPLIIEKAISMLLVDPEEAEMIQGKIMKSAKSFAERFRTSGNALALPISYALYDYIIN